MGKDGIKIFGVRFTPEEVNLLFGSTDELSEQESVECVIEEVIENPELDSQELINKFSQSPEGEGRTLSFIKKLPTYHNCKNWEDVWKVSGRNAKETTCITLFALGNILPFIEQNSGAIVGPILAKIAYHNSDALKQKLPQNWEEYIREFNHD